MPISRPYFGNSIDQLEVMYGDRKHDSAVVKDILHELNNRSSRRGKKLEQRIREEQESVSPVQTSKKTQPDRDRTRPMGSIDEQICATLVDCLKEQYKAAIRYQGFNSSLSERVISPQRFSKKGEGTWYVDSWCDQSNAARSFRLDRIQGARKQGKITVEMTPDQLGSDIKWQSQYEFAYIYKDDVDIVIQQISGKEIPEDADTPDGVDGIELIDDVPETEADQPEQDISHSWATPENLRLVRPIGEAPDTPDKWTPPSPKQSVTLNVDSSAKRIDRMIVALDSLIQDIKRTGKGATTIRLTGGSKFLLEGDTTCYEFAYESENEIQEGLEVTALVDGKEIAGNIMSVSTEKILIKFEGSQKRTIKECIIKIDNTSLIKSLKKTLEKVSVDTPDWFNSDLALKVIDGKGINELKKAKKGEFNEVLNVSQIAAIDNALKKEVSFVWGPPGTGKTHTLGELVRTLYEQGEKILVCSNTNQAVDQLLLKLCKVLGRDHPAMEDGHVVRIGKIDHEELEKEWGEYVKLDNIVERKGRQLTKQRQDLELKKEKIQKEIEPSQKIHEKFIAYDKKDQAGKTNQKTIEIEKKKSEVARSAIDAVGQSNRSRRSNLEKKIKELDDERKTLLQEGRKRRDAFLTFLHRSQEDIDSDLKNVARNSELGKQTLAELPKKMKKEKQVLTTQLNGHEKKIEELGSKILDHKRELASLKHGLKNYSRTEIEKEIGKADAKTKTLDTKIKAINDELAAVKETITKGSKILGATVTKTHLSPDLFHGVDTVIIDEASMVILPAAFFTSGLAKTSVVISGDYLQLSPIVMTQQNAILDEIGRNIFESSGVQENCENQKESSIVTLLDTQYRMPEKICGLVSEPLYRGRLLTEKSGTPLTNDELISDEITIIDTSSVHPTVSRAPTGSWYNLMHGLVVRNLIRHLHRSGYVDSLTKVGICTPYKAQANLLKGIVDNEKLSGLVRAGTVHRYQGDEKETMILDIPDGLGQTYVGMFLQADSPTDAGAKLFNVAMSRSRSRLVIVANLTQLDMKLPNSAILRGMINSAQTKGTIVDVGQILELEPIKEELIRLGVGIQIEEGQINDSLYRQSEFDAAFVADVRKAKRFVSIFSAFITTRRVGIYADLFKSKIAEGVQIRCVTRPPSQNGPDYMQRDGKEALELLQAIGCIVDIRWNIHEKVIVIDDKIIWFGSLNPLSFTERTDEIMMRLEGEATALEVERFLSIERIRDAESARGVAARKENPTCDKCGSRTVLMRNRNRKRFRSDFYFQCEANKDHIMNEERGGRSRQSRSLSQEELRNIQKDPPNCPEDGAHGPMTFKPLGQWGPYWHCDKCGKNQNARLKAA